MTEHSHLIRAVNMLEDDSLDQMDCNVPGLIQESHNDAIESERALISKTIERLEIDRTDHGIDLEEEIRLYSERLVTISHQFGSQCDCKPVCLDKHLW